MSLADLVLGCPQRGRRAIWRSSSGVNQAQEHPGRRSGGAPPSTGWTVEWAGARPDQAVTCDFVYTRQLLQGSQKEEGRDTETTRGVMRNSRGGLEPQPGPDALLATWLSGRGPRPVPTSLDSRPGGGPGQGEGNAPGYRGHFYLPTPSLQLRVWPNSSGCRGTGGKLAPGRVLKGNSGPCSQVLREEDQHHLFPECSLPALDLASPFLREALQGS